MRAMTLHAIGAPLVFEERATPAPGPGRLLIRVEACGVCRTDLHVVDGELPDPRLPIVPGHEVVGLVERLGAGVENFAVGERVGVPWLAHACGHCLYCDEGRENLCDHPEFTGYTRDGGYASHLVAEAAFTLKLPATSDPVATAPLLCAGLIGWRCLKAAGPGKRIGLYGFGAAAHIVAQVCRHQGREVLAFTRPGDEAAQRFARGLGAAWAGGSDEAPPEPLDAAILFAPVGALVPVALRAVRKGGRVVCGGIHMSDIPSFPYAWLWEEREIVSVANLTRRDGVEFFAVAAEAGVRAETRRYNLADANLALADLREGRLQGAAVLTP
ncbi:MAG: zinc-dependent alcohol dehydrogenase family protein [Roseiarcus sp.]